MLCTERNTTRRAAVAKHACSRLVIKSVGQRDAESRREERGGAHNLDEEKALNTFCHWIEKKDKE